jgi:hypothetical protein
MIPVKNEKVKAERLTGEDAHYFFGYYDTPAWSESGRYHLCHKVKFMDRLPRPDDVAIVGVFDVEERSFEPVAETTAWNFQQGSMLQWHPAGPERKIIYNTRVDGEYRGVVRDLHSGDECWLEQPVANVDPTGAYAISVNFDRLFDFRPGYGYAGAGDRDREVNHPQDDGVFLIDLATGSSKLVLSLQQLWEFTGGYFGGEDKKLLINHITFNTDGTRFVMLVRNFSEQGSGWKTAVVTANRDGSGLFLLSDYGYASHYQWRDRDHIAFHSGGAEVGGAGNQLYVLKDRSHEGSVIDERFFLRDGHCSYSPDLRYMLYDSYPDRESYRHLYLYDLQERRGVTLGSYYSLPASAGDIRCDLHPRWNRQGTAISFDSTHEGRRHMYMMDVKEVWGR